MIFITWGKNYAIVPQIEDLRKQNDSLKEKLATRDAQVQSYKDLIKNYKTTTKEKIAVKVMRLQQIHEQAIQEIQAILDEDDVNEDEDNEDEDKAGPSNREPAYWNCDHCIKKLKTREDRHYKSCARLAQYH